jgi:AcrR family transcriptional regulator
MTRKESKEKRVSDILDAAITEFVEKGYENASMESIAERAGITKGGVYYHFKSKDGILIKANERFMEPVLALMAEAAACASPTDGLMRYIERYLAYWTGHHRELTFIFLTLTKTMSDRTLWPPYSGYTAQCTSFFEGLYRKGMEAGELRAIDPAAVALALMAALDGVTAYIVMDDRLTMEGVVANFQTAFIHSFRLAHHEK